MKRKLITYAILLALAAVSITPFLYMLSSSVKPRSVFFSSPFLPTTPLFLLDESTGDLAAGDISLLPEPGTPQRYTLEIDVFRGDQNLSTQTITLLWGSPDQLAENEVLIPPDIDVNQSLTQVPSGEASPPTDPTTAAPLGFELTDGNDRGLAGVAWGLLTADNFDRLFRGEPLDTDGDDVPDARRPTGVWRALVNSIFYASVSALLATLASAMGGYSLAKFRYRGRATLDNAVLASLVIPGAVLIAPGYQVLYGLGLLDTYAGLILPALGPAFGVYLFRQAMISSVPDGILEAARIDGCGEIKMFFVIVLPMVRPMTGAFLLINYLGAWNNFITPQIVLQSPEKYPLAVWIAQLRGVYGIDYGLIMAGTLVAIAPPLVLFLMLQREFISGLTAGAVKG
ncbi:MAG: carbohydrate ABC transporter permease [Planctomycetota bacterium]